MVRRIAGGITGAAWHPGKEHALLAGNVGLVTPASRGLVAPTSRGLIDASTTRPDIYESRQGGMTCAWSGRFSAVIISENLSICVFQMRREVRRASPAGIIEVGRVLVLPVIGIFSSGFPLLPRKFCLFLLQFFPKYRVKRFLHHPATTCRTYPAKFHTA